MASPEKVEKCVSLWRALHMLWHTGVQLHGVKGDAEARVTI